ncbi:CehA/McbA family metallohydrolase [Peptococcaceae bacterium]|nr:CehA/McbA family metallohydrolase [Peptococcaceae bacterium]
MSKKLRMAKIGFIGLTAVLLLAVAFAGSMQMAEARESNVQTIHGRITDENGNPIIARVELWRITEELGKEVPEEVQFACDLFHAGYSDANGWYSLNAPPGGWLIRVSKGPEWEVKTFRHSIRDIQLCESVASHRLDVTLRRLYHLDDLGWFSGDPHFQTLHSDGRDTPAEMARAAIGNGLDFAVITDHNTIDGWEEWLEQRTDRFLPIVGEEATTGSLIVHRSWGHHLVVGTSTLDGGATVPYIPVILKGILSPYMFHSAEQVQRLIDLTHEQGGVFAVSHPMAPVPWLTFSGWAEIRNFDAIEVWNGFEAGPHTPSFYWGNVLWNANTMATQVWFEFLNAGNRIAAWGASDSHDAPGLTGLMGTWVGKPTYWRNTLGNARTYVHAGELEPRKIKDALRDGRAFITSGFGPLLLVESGGKGPGEIVRVGADGKVPLNIKVLSNQLLPAHPQAIRIIEGGEVVEELPTRRAKEMEVSTTIRIEEDSWVVVQVFGRYPTMAMTNAIYLDMPPYGDWDDPEWRVPEGAERWMNPFPRTPEITVPDGPAIRYPARM